MSKNTEIADELRNDPTDSNFFSDKNVPPSNWFKFSKPGDRVMGILVSVSEKEGKDGLPDQVVFELKRPNGEFVKVGVAKHKDYILARARTAQYGDRLGFEFKKLIPAAKKGFNDAKSIEVYVEHIAQPEPSL